LSVSFRRFFSLYISSPSHPWFPYSNNTWRGYKLLGSWLYSFLSTKYSHSESWSFVNVRDDDLHPYKITGNCKLYPTTTFQCNSIVLKEIVINMYYLMMAPPAETCSIIISH
jgi:hypothetical protein